MKIEDLKKANELVEKIKKAEERLANFQQIKSVQFNVRSGGHYSIDLPENLKEGEEPEKGNFEAEKLVNKIIKSLRKKVKKLKRQLEEM